MKISKRKTRKNGGMNGYSSTYSSKGFKIGTLSLGFVTVVILALVSLFYLAQSNQITTKGYALQELENKKTKILSENERLQVEAARLESLNKASEKAKDLSMVPLKELKYFNSKKESLAVKY